MGVRPAVLFVGPIRTGTTWIYEFLRNHPGVCLPGGAKEIFFFDRNYDKGRRWYDAHFRRCSREFRCIEMAPTLFSRSEAPERVRAVLGDPLIVVGLRHPVERAISHYAHYLRYGIVQAVPAAAMRNRPEIVEASRYSQYLPLWQQRFSAVHLIDYTVLQADPLAYGALVTDVAEIPPTPVPKALAERRVNGGIDHPGGSVAGWVTRGADLLRRRRLYPIVEAAKRLGLKSLIYGVEDRRTDDTRDSRSANGAHRAAEKVLLNQLLAEEVDFYSRLTQGPDRRAPDTETPPFRE